MIFGYFYYDRIRYAKKNYLTFGDDMKKSNVIIVGGILVLLISIVLLCYFGGNMLRKNIQADMEEILDEVLIVNKQGDKIESNIAQIEQQVGTISEEVSQTKQHIDLIDEEVSQIIKDVGNLDDDIDFIEDEVLEEIKTQINDESSKIVFLEKELIRQASGVYDNYNFYYNEEANYYSYSVRFLKDYFYKTEDSIPAGEDHEGFPGSLKIFLNESKDARITIWLWHSFGVSTTAKNEPVKTMSTDEGEIAEYVKYEIDNKGYIDFGFEEYTLKVSVVYDKENSAGVVGKVFDIVRTIMFYESLYVK